MSTAALYILALTFTVAFVFYTKWQMVDEDDGPGYKPSDKRWHRAGLIMRLSTAAMALIWVLLPAPSWSHLPLVFTLSAAVFDIGINVVNKKKPLYIAGHGIDKKLGNKKWLAYLIALMGAAYLIFSKEIK